LREYQPGSLGFSLQNAGLAAGALLVSLNVWTGAPLLAVWIASRLFPSMALSLGAVGVVVALLATFAVMLVFALARLNAAYDELTGRPSTGRRDSPWARFERGEEEPERRQFVPTNGVEAAVMVSIVAAVLTFEVYFFFFEHPGMAHPSV
jgi:hypothetical protein